MYGQQVGKFEQPLENVVVEETEREGGLREVHITIAMKDRPSTIPIAEAGAQLAEETVGALWVEGNNKRSFSFPITFEEYMDRVKAAKPGESIDPIYSPVLVGGYDCIGCNIESIREGSGPELFYVLTTNDVPEKICAVGQAKSLHPLANVKSHMQGVMAYLLRGAGEDTTTLATVRDGIVEVAGQHTRHSAPLTLAQMAVMTEALFEIDYHTHKNNGESGGPQGMVRVLGPPDLN